MTKEKWLEIIKLIASFAVGVATIVLAQSCISSWNVNKNSQGATINSKQSSEQKNDSKSKSKAQACPRNALLEMRKRWLSVVYE